MLQKHKVFLDPLLIERARIDLVEMEIKLAAKDLWVFEYSEIFLTKDENGKVIPGQELLQLNFIRYR